MVFDRTDAPDMKDLPSVKELREYAASQDTQPTGKQVAKHFNIDKSQMKELRKRLRKVGDGKGPKGKRRDAPKVDKPMLDKPSYEKSDTDKPAYEPPKHDKVKYENKKKPKVNRSSRKQDEVMAPVSVLIITGTTKDGDLIAEPANWKEKHVPPTITISASSIQKGRAPAMNDRVLAKMSKISAHHSNAEILRILPKSDAASMLGLFALTAKGGMVEPVNRKDKSSYSIAEKDMNGAVEGELVEVESLPAPKGKHLEMRQGKIVRRLGDMDHPGAASTIAIHQHDIRTIFPDNAIAQAELAENPVLTEGRADLRNIKLITIDGADARDFDDAVFAEPDTDPENKGGWHLIIAIADVAHYVRPDSPLDEEARERGNSSYFPDRVVPMLPEALSNGLCSLNPDVDRYCLAVHIWVNAEGETLRHEFVRGLMRSHARWTYEQAQHAHDTGNDEPDYLKNLYAAYASLQIHIKDRGPLQLNFPEFKPVLNDEKQVTAIDKRDPLASHKLIEAFMIAANVAAAETLEKREQPAVFRVHSAPDAAKVSALKDMLKPSGYTLSLGNNLHARLFNGLLEAANERDETPIIHTAVLRSQMRATYEAVNDGHFGLSLQSYTHFTSPIRRYSDLIVHRGLIAAHNFGDDGTTMQHDALNEIAIHISDTERNSMKAERTAMDRYMAAFMKERVGATFPARISGMSGHGMFVGLDENGADGFIPARTLSDDFYAFDEKTQQLKGRRKGRVFSLGQAVEVTLLMADAITGSLRFTLTEFNKNKGKGGYDRPKKSGRTERKRSTEQKFKRKKKRENR